MSADKRTKKWNGCNCERCQNGKQHRNRRMEPIDDMKIDREEWEIKGAYGKYKDKRANFSKEEIEDIKKIFDCERDETLLEEIYLYEEKWLKFFELGEPFEELKEIMLKRNSGE